MIILMLMIEKSLKTGVRSPKTGEENEIDGD